MSAEENTTFYTLPAGPAVIHGRPIIGVAVDLAQNMARTFSELTTVSEMAAKLAELAWFDASDDEDDHCPPNTMWWALVHILGSGGVTPVHLQAEPAGGGVVVYQPTVVDEVTR